jgi:hypothetical protein
MPAACDGIVLAGDVRMRSEAARPSAWESYDLTRGFPQRHYVSKGYAATANLAVAADQFAALGGFDTTHYSGGDAEFCRRATAAGGRLELVEDAVVFHPPRASWEALSTKARRIVGAKLQTGSRRQRLSSAMRTVLPPVIAWSRFATTPGIPLAMRIRACLVQAALWGVEVREAVRIWLGREAERK